MIEISLFRAVQVYLFAVLIVLFVLWAVFERRKKFKKFDTGEDSLWQCSICTYTYIDSRHEEISACPRCGSYNKKKRGRF